jgi:hypothetical protein
VWIFACVAEWRVPFVSTPEAFNQALEQCPTVVLTYDPQRWMPEETLRRIRAEYAPAFRFGSPDERRYVEILRRRSSSTPERTR